jgi:hypothetical protein
MAGGRRIQVTVEADTDGDFDKAARGLENVAKDADDADGSLRRMSKGHQNLTSEIDKTSRSIRGLREEFVRTGDVSLLGDADKLERNLKKLEGQFTKLFGDRSQLVYYGKQAGEDFGGGFLGTLQSLPPQAFAGIAAGLTVLGPIAGGIVAAGITAAVGGGALATGIALAAQDPAVGKAFGGFAEAASVSLHDAADVFVEPLVAAADKFGDAFSGPIMSGIRDDFATLAPVVSEVVDGLIGFAEKAMPGVNELVQASVPVLGAFAEILPQIGQGFSNMAKDISGASEGAVSAVHVLGDTIEGTFDLIGFTLGTASHELATFDALLHGEFVSGLKEAADAGALFPDWLVRTLGMFGSTGQEAARLIDVLQRLAPTLDINSGAAVRLGAAGENIARSLFSADGSAAQYGQDLTVLAQRINEVTLSADSLETSMVSKLLTATLSLDQATVGFAGSSLQLEDVLAHSRPNMDLFTESGNKQRQAILGVVGANIQEYEAMVRAGAGADEARSAYEANTRSLEAQLTEAGYTQDEINHLIGTYRDVPHNVDTDIAIHGLTDAITNLDHTLRLINGLHDRTVTVTTFFTQVGRPAAETSTGETVVGPASWRSNRHGGIDYAAARGMITDSPTVLFGERGTKKETYVPWAGISDQRAYELMAPTARNFGMDLVRGRSAPAAPITVPSAGGGGRMYSISVSVPLGGTASDVGAEIIERIKDYEQLNGSIWRG